ncbi:translocase of chloroplast 159, chloroplastic [Morus notabilis]|uniref:translocase of chloroplast 159, chloroplastic n=1 Tax=Morus notabilis TaxID=981085 RepID=UPI000CECF315|nr:translocase of chloroplast 159, chloroplastic [Morus notabilis]
MDPKFSSSPETTTTPTPEPTYSYSPGSSSPTSSAYAFSGSASYSPYQFSDVGASTDPYVYGGDNSESRGGSVVAGSGGGAVSGDGDGFGSGEKEFGGDFVEGENPRAVMGGEDGGTGVFVVGSSAFSMRSNQRPIAKVSIDDDDDDYALGGSEVRVLGAGESGEESGGGDKVTEIGGAENSVEVLEKDEASVKNENFGELVKENGFSDEKEEFWAKVNERVVVEQESEDFGGRESGIVSEVAEDGKTLDNGKDKDNSVTVEPTDDKLVDSDGANFTGGDSVVEAVQVNVSAYGAAIVGDVEGIEDSEIKGMAVPEGVKLDNEFDTLTCDSEELLSLKSLPVDSKSDGNVVAGSGDGGLAEQETVITGSGEVDSKNEPGREHGVEADSAVRQIRDEVEIGADSEEGRDGDETNLVNSVSDLAPHELEQDKKAIANGEEAKEDELEAGIPVKSNTPESLGPSSTLSREIALERGDEEKQVPDGEDDDTDEETEDVVYGSTAKQFMEELERASGADSSRDNSQRIDGQIVTDSDEEVDTDEEEEGGRELFDSAALAALLKAATGASPDGGNVTITTSDGPRLFSVERPAGLGSSLPRFASHSRPNHSSIFAPTNPTVGGDSESNLSGEEKKRLEKFQQLRVKYLRLVNRLGVSTDDTIPRQVLYRLALVSGRVTSREFSLETAKETSLQLEAERKDDLDFSLNILVLGKTGVGKSATINSIFGEEKTPIYAFGPSTTTVKEIVGTVDGVKIRVFDTPGLKSAAMEQSFNRGILSSVKKVTKKCPPDIVLYVDRLDTQSRDLNDLPLLRTITSALGPSTWRSGIVTLTHAASSPPDGPTGSPLNYELFVAQRSQIVQQTIGQAVGDLRVMSPSLMNPVSLVENHPSCRKNRDGQKVLPNGQTWRSQLLLLCYSMKILSEASNLSKPQESFDNRKLFGFRTRSPPLPYLLSWLLQSRTHPKLSADQGGDNGDSDIDLDDLSDSDGEEEDEYDQLPPFKPLRKSQFAKLTREQKKAYLEEYDYRVKLLQKKQWREELKRMKDMKKGKVSSAEEYGYPGEDDPENGAPAAVPVALPDMVLPPSFDGDNPAYRYRFLEPTSQFLARPVLDTHGWDHDCGYDGVNVEHSLAIANRFPGAVSVQITKDKKEFNLHLDSSVAAKHGESGSTMAGFDIQNIGKQLAYIVRGETKFKSFRKNKTSAGASLTFLGENISTGFKIEDQFGLGKRVVLVGSTGIVKSQGDSAYGANLELRLREADFPIGQDQSSLGLSLVKWRGDLALGANLQSQFSIGRNYKMAVRAGLNNKLSGQISVRTSSSEQLQIALLQNALVALLPIVGSICKILWPGPAVEKYSLY